MVGRYAHDPREPHGRRPFRLVCRVLRVYVRIQIYEIPFTHVTHVISRATYLLVWPQDGIITKEAFRRVYDVRPLHFFGSGILLMFLYAGLILLRGRRGGEASFSGTVLRLFQGKQARKNNQIEEM
jgi:hypothetical protein